MLPDPNNRLDQLLAREDIAALSHRYARAQDERDAAAQRAVFHDDAELDYPRFKGGPDAFVAFAQDALRAMGKSHHLLGQIEIDIMGDRAGGIIYFIAWHRLTQAGEQKDLIVGGRYIDQYSRRDGVWKIAFRSEIVDWSRLDPSSDDFYRSAAAPSRST